MIEEIRIIGSDGMQIYTGSIDLDKAMVTRDMGETNFLFASLISAIQIVSNEVRASEVKEIVYQDNKIIMEKKGELTFLVVAAINIPQGDLNDLLENLIRMWSREFGKNDFVYQDDDIRDRIDEVIIESLRKTFWWMDASFTLQNNLRFISTVFTAPDSTYFVPYLPHRYFITSILFFLLPFILSIYLGTIYDGLSTRPARFVPAPLFDYQRSAVALVLLWLGQPLLMELFNYKRFNLTAYIKLSGVVFGSLSFLVFFTSKFYFDVIYLPIRENFTGTPQTVVEFLLNAVPINVSFFGFLLLLGYSTNFINPKTERWYLGRFLLSFLIIISITDSLLV